MTDKITLSPVGSLQDTTTAATTINQNFTTIQEAFDNTLSLDGTSPNQMESNLDMNSNQILNLPSPATINSPARLIDVVTNPTIIVPPVGTSGATVPLLNANNTFSGNNTFTGTTTLGPNNITSGNNTFTGNNTFSGTTTLGPNNLVAGNNTYTGSNTFAGTTTFTGNAFNNNATFYAHNNGVNFTFSPVYVGGATNYYLYTPSTIYFNHGGCFNTANGRFTPPAGGSVVRLTARFWVTSGFSNPLGNLVAKCYKNFTIGAGGIVVAGIQTGAGIGNLADFTTTAYMALDTLDTYTAGDYYGYFLFVDTPGLANGVTVALDGNMAHSFITGTVIS
jgi:hypothetical protein